VSQPTIPDLIRGIAGRVIAERDSGRPVAPGRLAWAEEVLRSQRPPAGSNPVSPCMRAALPDAAQEAA
jgi:hypothetical protein